LLLLVGRLPERTCTAEEKKCPRPGIDCTEEEKTCNVEAQLKVFYDDALSCPNTDFTYNMFCDMVAPTLFLHSYFPFFA
jgi:hypothetical protein